MDQEKIGKTIKEIRKKEGLTQKKFASKYGVTYQAVSKWENGKNIPDIPILKQICEDYQIDLNSLLEGNDISKNSKKKHIIVGMIAMIILFIFMFICILFWNGNDDFYFKKLSTDCEDFTLYGSIAYNSSKTSIYISNIQYCGVEEEQKYQDIECSLYEIKENVKTKISSYQYHEEEAITLDEFLETVDFQIEHYSKTCTMYEENSLYLEIEATDANQKTQFYKIPLTLEESCTEFLD